MDQVPRLCALVLLGAIFYLSYKQNSIAKKYKFYGNLAFCMRKKHRYALIDVVKRQVNINDRSSF